MKFSYYPGCVAKATGKEYEVSTQAVCSALGIELEEIDDWNCCGATHVSNDMVATGLAARVLSRADMPVVTGCSICYSRLRMAQQRLQENATRRKVNAVLDKEYSNVEVRHLIEVLRDALEVAGDSVMPLTDLKVASYYGCLLTRPGGGIDSPENPSIMERFAESLGAKAVDFRLKMRCCGGPIFMAEEVAASETAFRILKDAKRSGADVVMVACPLCHLMLDANQRAMEKRFGEEVKIPVLYLTQLVGLALGLGPEELGMGMNSVSPTPVLEKIAAAREEEAGEAC